VERFFSPLLDEKKSYITFTERKKYFATAGEDGLNRHSTIQRDLCVMMPCRFASSLKEETFLHHLLLLLIPFLRLASRHVPDLADDVINESFLFRDCSVMQHPKLAR